MKRTQKLWLCLSMAVLALSLVGCQFLSRTPYYSVKRVSDGDTLTVTNPKGGDVKVRFACVDAPEIPHSIQEKKSRKVSDLDQFEWGFKAKARLKQLVEQKGDRVILTIVDSDRYGRKIAEVRLRDGTLVQEVLAREGLALVYQQYIKNCPSAATVEQAEATARQQGRGVWSDARFTEPWEYRKKLKASSTNPQSVRRKLATERVTLKN